MKAETQIQFRCSKELKRRAIAYAKKNDTTVSALMVEFWDLLLIGEISRDKRKSK